MVSETVILRPAKEEDVEALVRLLQRSWLVTWAPELPFDAVKAFANFDPAKAHAEAEWREFVVAARNDSLVGMVQVEGDRITHIHVDPAHWSGGVGSALLDAAEQKIAQSHAVARLEVRGFNIRAQAFYKRRGWVEASRYPGMECGSPVENVGMERVLR